MITDVGIAIEKIKQSVRTQDARLLKEAAEDYPAYCHSDQAFDERLFECILELMGQREFLNMDGTFDLLLLFERLWAGLTVLQKEKLINAIEPAYDRFADWMSCFVLSELLGEYYCDDRAFQLLCRLKSSTQGTGRALLPMAFEKLAQNTSDSMLRGKAIAELKSMTADRSQQVQGEAMDSLNRLAARGIVRPTEGINQ